MNITEILKNFSNGEIIQSMSFSEKMLGVGITVLIGMGLTFVVLIALQYFIQIITVFAVEKSTVKKEVVINDSEKNNSNILASSEAIIEEEIENSTLNNEEIVAAITAALTIKLGGKNKFVIKNIVRVQDETPTWSRIGLMDQVMNKL